MGHKNLRNHVLNSKQSTIIFAYERRDVENMALQNETMREDF